MARYWYTYNGVGDPLLCSSYNLSILKPSCINGCTVCAIYATGAASPTCPLSYNMRTYIASLQNYTCIAQPFLNGKIYVYGRN